MNNQHKKYVSKLREAVVGNHSQKTDDFEINRGISQTLKKFLSFLLVFRTPRSRKRSLELIEENILKLSIFPKFLSFFVKNLWNTAES